MTTRSPERGTVPVLQLAAFSQEPLTSLAQNTVRGTLTSKVMEAGAASSVKPRAVELAVKRTVVWPVKVGRAVKLAEYSVAGKAPGHWLERSENATSTNWSVAGS